MQWGLLISRFLEPYFVDSQHSDFKHAICLEVAVGFAQLRLFNTCIACCLVFQRFLGFLLLKSWNKYCLFDLRGILVLNFSAWKLITQLFKLKVLIVHTGVKNSV
jgi:hypothetical protein